MPRNPVFEYLLFCDVFDNERGLLLRGSEIVVLNWIKNLQSLTLCNEIFLYKLCGLEKELILSKRGLNNDRGL